MSRIIDTQALPTSLEITSSSTGPSNWYGNIEVSINNLGGTVTLVSYLNEISPGDTIDFYDQQDTIVTTMVNATYLSSSTDVSTTVNANLDYIGSLSFRGQFTTSCKPGQTPMTFLGTLSEADGDVMYINTIQGSIVVGDTLNYNDGVTTGTLTVTSAIDPDPPSDGFYTALIGIRGTSTPQEVGCVFWKSPFETKKVHLPKSIVRTLLRK